MSSTDKTLKDKIQGQIQLITAQTGVDGRIIIAAAVAVLLFVVLGFFDKQLTTLVGVVYPAFWSLKAIESSEAGDDKQWLTYWAVFAVFQLLDMFSGFILSFIPFYFFLKLGFLIWCFMPNTRGATVIYDMFLRELFKKYEEDLGKIVDKLTEESTKLVAEGKQALKDNQATLTSAAISGATKLNSLANEVTKEAKTD